MEKDIMTLLALLLVALAVVISVAIFIL